VIFAKMHGLGNDFVVVNGFIEHLDDSVLGNLARNICDRNFGVGADGLILVLPSESADYRMRMFNPDGSEAQMCGNGIRCVAEFAYERGITRNNPVRVETLDGGKTLEVSVVDGAVEAVRVDMGRPKIERQEIPTTMPGSGPVIAQPLELDGRNLSVTCVSVGNPHCVTFVGDVESFPVRELGPRIERHPLFPERTNAEFVEIRNRREMRMRVWERGAGETLACGTGACASVVASVLNGKTERAVTVHLSGGDLQIEWLEDGPVVMTGPAVEVFTGEVGPAAMLIWTRDRPVS